MNNKPSVDTEQDINLRPFLAGMVNISTAHIPEHTAIALGQDEGKNGSPALWSRLSYVYFHEYGWIVSCSDDAAEAVREDHPELSDLIKRCRGVWANFLKLDCDAEKVLGLPTFEW
jgi:hypothetical protein